MVFSGHVLHSGTGQLVSAGVHGSHVYQMLANYQSGVRAPKTVETASCGSLRLILLIKPLRLNLIRLTWTSTRQNPAINLFLKTLNSERIHVFIDSTA